MGGNKNPQPCWVCGFSVRALSAHRKTAGHIKNAAAKAPLPEGFLDRFRQVPDKDIPAQSETKQLEATDT
jgi:hypothetical protein